MVLEIRAKLPPAEAASVIAEIVAVTETTDELTPRSAQTLSDAIAQGRLLTAYAELELVGWLLVEPLTPRCSELGLTYVKPAKRGSGAFELLAEKALEAPGTLLFATYDPGLMTFAQRVLGFRTSNLGEFLRVSRGRFLFKRLDRASRKSIRGRMRNQKPLYGILVRK